jgi:hypothetical protein
MMNIKTMSLAVVLACCLAMASPGRAQNTQNTMTPEKRALINDLLKVIQAERNIQASMTMAIGVMRKSFAELISKTVPNEIGEKTSESDEARKRAAELTSKTMERFQDRLMKEINVSELVENVTVPLYDKFYTESELKDLIAFYKTPTGQKSISIQPQLTGEGAARTMDYLMPKMQKITREMSDELEGEIKKILERHDSKQ